MKLDKFTIFLLVLAALVFAAGQVVNPVPVVPVDPVPEGVHGFTRLACEEASKIAEPARAKSKALAANFTAAAGELEPTTPDDMNAKLREKNRATLGADLPAWTPFFVTFSAKLDALNEAGTVTSPPHYVEIYKAVADGLNLVK